MGNNLKIVKVTFRDKEVKEFSADKTFSEIVHNYQKYFNYPILAVKRDNVIVNLDTPIEKDCTIDFVDRSSAQGLAIYESSCQLILVTAVHRLFKEKAQVRIEHSIDKGVYCELTGKRLDKDIVKQIENEMKKIVEEDLSFIKLPVSRIDTMKFYRKYNLFDRANVLKYISNSYVNLYRLDDYYDYFYTEMADSSRAIDSFKLTYIKGNGFQLQLPTVQNPEITLDYVHHRMLFEKFLDYTRWGEKIGITCAAELNEITSYGKYDDVIQLAEANFESQLTEVSQMIAEDRKRIKLVLIAGPSSSGKTTTSKRLAIYLKTQGFNPHPISTDDYFLDRKDTPKLPNGEYDFESINAVDVELFNKQLTNLLAGEKVLLPQYNFVLGKKEFKNRWLQLGDQDIIIIEGIHALNDVLTSAIDRRNKFKIYISPLTQLNIDDHNRIHTSDTRKLRRIVRDNKYRGHLASDTLNMWDNIKEGENKFIFPFQDAADTVINTALVYEIGVLKTYAEPLLFSVQEDDPCYPEALRLINLLRNFLSIPSEGVPSNSILREFIGGSVFKDE